MLPVVAYVVITVISGKVADRVFDPFFKRAREQAGKPVRDPETGVEQVPWQHRPLSGQAALIVVSVVVVGLAVLSLWLG